MKCTGTELFNVASVIPFSYVETSWFGYNLLSHSKNEETKGNKKGVAHTFNQHVFVLWLVNPHQVVQSSLYLLILFEKKLDYTVTLFIVYQKNLLVKNSQKYTISRVFENLLVNTQYRIAFIIDGFKSLSTITIQGQPR